MPGDGNLFAYTHGQIEAMTPQEQRAYYRALLAHWEANDQRQRQRDSEADQCAFLRGIVDEPGPIDNAYSMQSSTNRTPRL